MADDDKEYRVHIAGKAVEQKMLEYLASERLHNECYALRTRVKPVVKLVEKVQRKSKKKEYDLLDITDVVGLRIVTLFRQEMEDVARKVLGMIFCTENKIFQSECVEEVIVYAVNHKHDAVVKMIKAAVSEFIPEEKITSEESEAGYSSIHIVTRCGLDQAHDLPASDFPDYQIPIEIQIRTVFEDAWGEIDHKYGYEQREGKSPDQKIHNPEHVKKHLRVMKSFVDACAQYADVIRQEATNVVFESRSENIRDADNEEYAIRVLQERNVPDEYIVRFTEIRAIRKEAEELQLTSKDESDDLYNRAITLLHELKGELLQEGGFCKTNDSPASEALRYYVILDLALCLLSTGHSANIDDAIELYLELLSDDENYPIVNYRLGQAFSKKNNYSLSAWHYNKVKKVVMASDLDGKGSLFLPDHDRDYILTTLPKVHGYSLWKHSLALRESGSLDEVLNLLVDAYKTTKDALSQDLEEDVELGIHNNLLYYAVDYAKCGGELDSPDGIPNGAIETHLQYLEPKIELTDEEDVFKLDTMAYAYQVCQDADNAKRYAQKVQEIIMSSADPSDPAGLDAVTTRMLKRAFEIVKMASK